MMHRIICTGDQHTKSKTVVFVLLAILSLSLTFSIHAAEIHKSISVVFNGDLVDLPAARTLYECDTTTIMSEDVLHILSNYHTVYISRDFEETDSAYTMEMTEDSILVCHPTLKGFYTLVFEDSTEASAACRDLLGTTDVLAANQDGLVILNAVTPNDSLFSQQWALNNTGQSGGTANADINAPEAWEFEQGGSSRKIALFDCGVWASHPDLQGRVSGDGVDFSAQYPYHGTLLAGIAAANTDNGIGIAGVDWHASILSKDIAGTTWNDVNAKIAQAVAAGADVLNYSFQSPEATLPAALGMAFAYGYNNNRVCVASAGNDGSNATNYPSDLSKVISVAASTKFDGIWELSNYGNAIDVLAPGEEVLSTYSPTTEFIEWDGTSISAAHVSGLASLLKNHWSSLSNEDIRHLIEYSADPRQNYRRIDADSAFKIMQNPNTLTRTSGGETSYEQHYAGEGIEAGYVLTFFGIPEFANGRYIAVPYDVYKSVAFPQAYYETPKAWGRGAQSSGYLFSDYSDPPRALYDFKDCHVVGLSATGVTLMTQVYKVYNILGQFAGWVPTEPQNVTFAYSVLGELELDPINDISGTLIFPSVQGNRYQLGWVDPNTNSTGEVIQRRIAESGNWADIDSLPRAETYTQYGLDQLVGSQIYYYRVRPATGRQGSVSWSPTISFRNPPQAPQSVTVWSSTYQGYAMPKTYVSWTAPSNQLASSINHYEVKVQYSSSDIRWYDTTATTLEFCADYDEEIQVTVYAVDNWDAQGRASSTVNFETPPEQEWTNCPPEGGGGNLVTPDSSEYGKAGLPTAYSLEQNFPNPFNPITSIALALPLASEVRLEVFNSLGQRTRTVYSGFVGAGRHEFHWDGRDDSGNPVSSGVYFYRVDAGTFSETRKMLLLM